MPSLVSIYDSKFISVTLGDAQLMLLISQYASRMKVVVVVTYVYFGINVERASNSLIERKSISKHSTFLGLVVSGSLSLASMCL